MVRKFVRKVSSCIICTVITFPQRACIQYVYPCLEQARAWVPPAHENCGKLCRLPIFLFNYNDRYLHGVYRATSHGEMEINPHGVAPLQHCDVQ